eukprot:scaffold3998_cov105-Pinguiococcus_pyrenoidosus.AAC.1
MAKLRDMERQLQSVVETLEAAKTAFPSIFSVLRNQFAANDVAAMLNASAAEESEVAFVLPDTQSKALLTPAQRVRRIHRLHGWKALTLEEQQWTMLDQTLHPELYKWARSRKRLKAA